VQVNSNNLAGNCDVDSVGRRGAPPPPSAEAVMVDEGRTAILQCHLLPLSL
jgi:hypothetical protein